jgi:hypothetical protein
VELLIFFEARWFRAFRDMRDGITEQWDIDGGWSPPADYEQPVRPSWLAHPGSIHDWERKTYSEYLAQWTRNLQKSRTVSAEPHLWEALKRARTASHVRRICSTSSWRERLRPLHEHAEQFLSALAKDSRYPRKARTKDNERMLYFARTMAGILCRTRPATALDKLRKLKHGTVRSCGCAKCTTKKMYLWDSILGSFADIEKQKQHPDSTVGFWPGSLEELDKNCSCEHCSLIALVRTRGPATA